MVGCFCHMVKAVVSDNFDHTEDVYRLQPCFVFFSSSRGFFNFFQESSVSVILVRRSKICRYLTGSNTLCAASAILFTKVFVANYLAGMSG